MDLYERCASAAFEWDRKNGHHKGGPWTWHMIGDEGRENYRQMVKAVLAEANYEGAVDVQAATDRVMALMVRVYGAQHSDETREQAQRLARAALGGQ